MRSLYISIGVISLCAAQVAMAADEPTSRTNSLLTTFKKVKTAPEGKALAPTDTQANQAVFMELDGYFDYPTLTAGAIEPHKNKLTPAQQTKVKESFTELIRLVSYPNSGTFLRDAKYTVKPGKKEGEKAQVVMHAEVPKEDFETDVAFVWEEQGGTYRIVDVRFDGSSMVRDYANQFGRIIEKEGSEGLVKKLETRLNKERKKQGI